MMTSNTSSEEQKDFLSSKICSKHQEQQRRLFAAWRYRWLTCVWKLWELRPQVPDLVNSSLPSPPPRLVLRSSQIHSSTASAEEFCYSFYRNEELENKLTRAPLLGLAKYLYYRPFKKRTQRLTISCIYETRVVDLPCLNYRSLECTTRKFRSFVFKIRKIVWFQIKISHCRTLFGHTNTSK